jgi:cytochrome c551/c552
VLADTHLPAAGLATAAAAAAAVQEMGCQACKSQLV